jgi:hypothetical protein
MIMSHTEHIAILRKGVTEWNRWRAAANHSDVDLSGVDLTGLNLNHVNFLRANLTGTVLVRTQLEHAQLKDAELTGAVLIQANLEHANARGTVFDEVEANGANFDVSTLRGARFRNARLTGARFHRAYLRDTDLSSANLSGSWLRLARLDGARCVNTNFTGADLRYASMVKKDLIVGISQKESKVPLRAHDLHTAQLLALMLDGVGVRRVLDSITSKLVLILGSFSPGEKSVLDALRISLHAQGYVAVTFDFDRPSQRDYAETVVTLAGMSRFVIADFTNAKEVRAEVAQARIQYRRVPIIPIAREGVPLPITMANWFSADELELVVRYASVDDLLRKLQSSVVEPAEARASRIAESIARSEATLRKD